jgi:ABC-type transport system involved in cytochrome bd biosynthesis fused ATPase/permease subunit
MYSSVRRLEADGDITWYWGDESQGGRRKYFRITEKGIATYARNKSNWDTRSACVAIRVHGLQTSYQKLHVLKGVDFDVASGSIFALLGSNGAGETTVVRILSTLLKPDDGTASVNGFGVLGRNARPARVKPQREQVRGTKLVLV